MAERFERHRQPWTADEVNKLQAEAPIDQVTSSEHRFLGVEPDFYMNWQITSDHVVYDIEAEAYNRLVFRRDNSSIPCALVLCCLTKDQSTWISVGEDELVIRKCCYYHFIDGLDTKNSSSKRLHIPRKQLLTPESLTGLKDSLYEGALS